MDSQKTDDRRHYPRDKLGVKDEWAALSKHQHEMNQQILRHHNELKGLQYQQLG